LKKNADNRMMYRIGVAARILGMTESQLVVGIPISATGKASILTGDLFAE
jgi:uncharacterized ferredoxin-like protein